ncbi:hypothetical protein GGTG_05164 [Gaeumannomyces tritici R3-111a-1]|uniref:Uncharacterized protein n=1 Tax=Gaeumannomyces tritici (strain R3-111a-1) TaxID=644352 RepID=J3NV51_GAET3|nr:hypothetical protein GGTG_05164 [Gaeumannomyces tritici R3-111a-1]EJT75227.1 hypothetical protein GGTG_05164 [Gaeumannomyces tritici R3-111a-1]
MQIFVIKIIKPKYLVFYIKNWHFRMLIIKPALATEFNNKRHFSFVFLKQFRLIFF